MEHKPIGLVYGLDIDAYHAGQEVSNSTLGDLARSPLHCYRLHLDPKRPPAPTRAGQLEGNLAHCAILEPLEFSKRYVVGPTVNRNTKVWHAFVDDNLDRIAIQADQYDTAMWQAEAVHALADIRDLLTAGDSEVSGFWIDPQTGLRCRCRPDWASPVGDDAVILLDVKTCSDASPGEFARQVYRKGYHRQDGMYSGGYEAASGKRVVGFVFIAVESAWPHAASACVLDDGARLQGRIEIRRLLDLYAKCLSENRWPGYGDAVHQISLPAWAV